MHLLADDSRTVPGEIRAASVVTGGLHTTPSHAAPLPQDRYDRLSRVLHWLVAAGIFYTMIFGYGMHFVTNKAAFNVLSTLNMSVGTVVAALMVVRYFWKFYRPAVSEGKHLKESHKSTARLAHELLYIIIFIVLISGFIMPKHGFAFFGVIDIPRLVTNEPVNDFFFIVHRVACIALGLMVVLHMAAVAKHHKDKYPVIRKML